MPERFHSLPDSLKVKVYGVFDQLVGNKKNYMALPEGLKSRIEDNGIFAWILIQYLLDKDRNFNFGEFVSDEENYLLSIVLMDSAESIASLCIHAGMSQQETLFTLTFLYKKFVTQVVPRESEELTRKVQQAQIARGSTGGIVNFVQFQAHEQSRDGGKQEKKRRSLEAPKSKKSGKGKARKTRGDYSLADN